MGRIIKTWLGTIIFIGGALMTIITSIADITLIYDVLGEITLPLLGVIIFLLGVVIQITVLIVDKINRENTKPLMFAKKTYVDERAVLITNIENVDKIAYSLDTGNYSAWEYHGTETVGGSNIYWELPTNMKHENYYFAHIEFVNAPKISSEISIAKKVWAEINFYNSDLIIDPGGIRGRWGDTKQPNRLMSNETMRGLLEVDFHPNYLGWELDIAMKHKKEKIGFAFDNDSYLFREFRRPDKKLTDKKYFVEVILRGINLDNGEKFYFELTIGNVEDGLDFSQIQCPKEIKKMIDSKDKERTTHDF